ncbi:MAG: hypothetical protein ACRD2C_01570 [Acidimicrobiales bacterium]
MAAAVVPNLDDRSAGPGDLAQRVQPVTLARDRRLTVGPPLDTLLPDGLARGTVVAVGARPGVAGATSLALALAAGPSQEGAWVAVVGARWLGLVAAAEIGVALERLVVVDVDVAGRRRVQLASVVAALVDGFDVVMVGPSVGRRLRRGDTRRLAARLRERGGVVVTMGEDLPGGAAQVRLEVTASTWEGLDTGHLQQCLATVEVTGRGAASRPRRADLVLRDGFPARGDSERCPTAEAIANGNRSLSPQPRSGVRYDLGLGA